MLDLEHAKPKCFGHDEIRVRAWLAPGPAIGWLPPLVAPGWLVYPTVFHNQRAWALWSIVPEDSHIVCTTADCAVDFVRLAPGSTLDVAGPPRWVIAIGHVNDPAAGGCHWDYASDQEHTRDDADAVAMCKRGFVLDAIEEVG